MSTAEAAPVSAPAPGGGAVLAGGVRRGAVRPWLRLLRSELSLVFRRWRNRALLAVVVAIPILLGTALRLAVPAGRARLLSVKYAAVVLFALSACLLVAASALIMGAILFPIGPVTLLSGNTVPLAEGLLKLLFVVLYVAGAMAMLGAIGLAISSLTEHPIGAIAAIMILAVASEVCDNIPQFAAIGPYLPTHWWLSFDSLLRTPIDTTELLHGLLSFGVYIVLFGSIAWARFTSADVTS